MGVFPIIILWGHRKESASVLTNRIGFTFSIVSTDRTSEIYCFDLRQKMLMISPLFLSTGPVSMMSITVLSEMTVILFNDLSGNLHNTSPRFAKTTERLEGAMEQSDVNHFVP
jgi:hypothetical protein